MRRLHAMVVVGVLVAVSGCADGKSSRTSAQDGESGVKPAVTADESFKVLREWTARYNRAITTGEEKLWRATVTGGLEAPVEARLRTYGKRSANAKISLLNPVMYVPRQSGFPQWFATAALERSDGGGRQQVLGVFVRAGAKDEWRAAHWLTFKGKPPELDFDPQGYVIPAEPRGLPEAHAAYLTSGDASGLTPDAYTVRARTPGFGDWKAERSRYQPGPGKPFALRTKDGGSLVLYGLVARHSMTGGTVRTLPAELGNYLTKNGGSPGKALEATWQWLVIGYAPLTGRGRVLGESVSLTTAR
ncbi:hypothetical protein [Spirillospora sp. CA-294931]|uniref:hypothetical protein n=1 Tax=Spirillospora sp. CA-294931 TaxID=3240042 RepID=UPI003D941D8F